jgi:hypothetical protein
LISLFHQSAQALHSLVNMLLQLQQHGSYANPCHALSNATIGQHTRHIIELYQCLLAGYSSASINYDDRKRNTLYENDATAAVEAIREIQETLQQPDKPVKIFCGAAGGATGIDSNYYREVLYNLEHCIHHQALIKVALLSIQDIQIDNSFGVAPSTLQYRQQCAQ